MMNKMELDPDKAEEKFQKTLEQVPLEKGDVLAMVIAALLTAVPLLLSLCALVMFVFWLVAGRG